LAFGLGIGLLLFLLTRASPVSFFSCTVLWAFEPTLLGFSAHLGSDVPETFFIFAISLVFGKRCSRPHAGWSLLAGLLLGLGVCSKFSVLFLVPALGIMEVLAVLALAPADRKNQLFSRGRDLFLVSTSFLAAVGLIYLPGTLTLPGHPWPLTLLMRNFNTVTGYFSAHHPC